MNCDISDTEASINSNGKNSKAMKIVIFVSSMFIIFLLYYAASYGIEQMQLLEPYITDTEFLSTIDCAPIFDANPGKSFVITFEIKATKPGRVLVYQQNGSTAKYEFRKYIDVTEKYQKVEIVVTPALKDENEEKSMLAFYGEYGSGVICTVRKINIEVYEE